jgi:hypothetical protein
MGREHLNNGDLLNEIFSVRIVIYGYVMKGLLVSKLTYVEKPAPVNSFPTTNIMIINLFT